MTITDRLDDELAVRATPGEASREGWRLRTRDQAAWASRKLARAHRELEELEAWKEREIERVEAAARPERERLERDVETFEALLGTYLEDLVRRGRRTKTLELPGGTLRIRKARPSLRIEDEAAAIGWLETHAPEYLRTSTHVDRAALKQALVADGERAVMVETGEVLPWARLEGGEGERASFSLPDDDEGEDA